MLPTSSLLASATAGSALMMARALSVPSLRPLAAHLFGAPALLGFATHAGGAAPAPAPQPAAPGAAPPPPEKQQIVMPPMGKPAGINQTFASGHVAPHPGMRPAVPPASDEAAAGGEPKEAFMEHPHYDWSYLETIRPSHLPPKDAADRVGLATVKLLRGSFDWATGYGPTMTEQKWLTRIIFLETVAGVPGMVAGMLRHLHSLRLMRRDAGWIHQLLEEAENERMHLLTALELRQPGPLIRLVVLVTQGLFFNAYFIAYLLWPKACHSFVGYLEEEAVRTYTHALEEIDQGRSLARWKTAAAPPIAQTYWGMPKGATLRDLVLAIRADEACHSHVNHVLKTLKPTDANPFALQGKSQLP